MNSHAPLLSHTLASPIGSLLLAWNERGLYAVTFADLQPRRQVFQRYLHKNGLCVRAEAAASDNPYARALEHYFAGDLKALEGLPLVLVGTPFQLEVWDALRSIPLGATTSYGALADQIGHPGAYRAVGTANGVNPISLFVPCHRVIGADRKLTGYGGGIDNKRWLLEHEGAIAASALRQLPTGVR